MEDIAKLLPTKSTKRVVKKRSILIYQGEIPRQAYIVLSGVFKVYRLGTFGEEQIVGFRTKGDLFPETWIFGKTSGALYYYEALEDAEVLTVEKPVLLELFATHPDIHQHVFDYIVNSYTGLLMQITALEQSRAAEKLLLMMLPMLQARGDAHSGIDPIDHRQGLQCHRLAEPCQPIAALRLGLRAQPDPPQPGKPFCQREQGAGIA